MSRRITRTGRALAAVALALLCTVAIAACGSDDDGADAPKTAATGAAANADVDGGATLDRLRDAGTVKIAIANEPPYAELKPDGTLTGISPEVVKAVMERLGVPKVEATVTGYDSMVPGLIAKQWDLIASGLSMNAERCKQILFSDPETASDKSWLVKDGNPSGVDSFRSAAETGVKATILSGSAEEAEALAAGVQKSSITSVSDVRSAVDALQAGRADAFPAPTQSLRGIEIPSGFEVVTSKDGDLLASGIGFRPDDRAFRDAFNTVFRQMKEDGTFRELADEFGFDGALIERARGADVDPACAAS